MALSPEQVKDLPQAIEYVPGFWVTGADPLEVAKTKNIKESYQPIKGTEDYYRRNLKGWQKLKYLVRSFFVETTSDDTAKLDELIKRQ